MVRARKNMATLDLDESHFLIGGDVSFGYTRKSSELTVRLATPIFIFNFAVWNQKRSIEMISYDNGEFSAHEYGNLDRILELFIISFLLTVVRLKSGLLFSCFEFEI